MDPSTDLTPTFVSNFSSFDSSVWTTELPHNLRNNPGTGELEYYGDATTGTNPFSTSDGVLSITAAPGPNPAGLPYDSGIITTQTSFAQLYGYFQITAALPPGTGMWPAFWLLPADLHGTDEIDVMEMLGSNGPDQYQATIHSPATGIDGTPISTGNLTTGFHSYGVYWTPTTISFWFDGNMVAVAPTPSDLNRPMFMLADLAVARSVTPQTPFPETMQISQIAAYAYDPSMPGPAAPLTVDLPASASGEESSAIALTGVSIADGNMQGAQHISVTVSDKSLGMMWIAPTDGVAISINDSWTVQFSGTLAAVNAALATLGYRNEPTAAGTPTSDTITVAAQDASGDMDSERIALSLGAGPTVPSFLFTADPTRVLAKPTEVFSFDQGAIADPHTDGGIADQIVNFQTGSDFLAFHGFAAGAQLVFDHLAAPGGVADPSQQYYRVADAQGGSPLILVHMAAGSAVQLGPADYGFYPS